MTNADIIVKAVVGICAVAAAVFVVAAIKWGHGK